MLKEGDSGKGTAVGGGDHADACPSLNRDIRSHITHLHLHSREVAMGFAGAQMLSSRFRQPVHFQ